MHKLLQRQLQRHLGRLNALPKPWGEFVTAVDEAYAQADADRLLLERSLELTSQELVQRNAELARSNAELEQFAYVASHDLQEPLRMVESYTQLLARRYGGQLGREADEFIAFIVGGVTRMQRLISDLLTYSRLGTRGTSCQPTDCEGIVETALTNLQASIQGSRAAVTRDPLPTVTGDGSQLVQLFQNLLGNAMKFHGAEPPRVHVSAIREGEAWRFAVRDHGIGIEPQYFNRIFVIFQRLHSREEYPGTGIGLAICKKIVERHGGRIWLDSTPGKGTTFFFTIPDRQPPCEEQP